MAMNGHQNCFSWRFWLSDKTDRKCAQWLLIVTEINDLYFALKSVSGSACNGLAFLLSDKTVQKFAHLSIQCQQQKCSYL